MTLVGISDDEAEDSREFADGLGIDFPLIYDADARYSRELVGMDDDGNALPGVVVLLPGRRIHFREVAEVKDDRVHAPELLRVVDGALLDSGRTAPRGAGPVGGFAPLSRAQLSAGLEAGAGIDLSGAKDAGALLGGAVTASMPLGRHALGDIRLGASAGDDERFDVSLAPRLRFPVSDDLGEYYLLLPVGVSFDPSSDPGAPHGTVGMVVGARAGLQFAMWPSWAFFIDAGASYRRFAGDGAAAALHELHPSASLGVTLLP